MIAFKFLRAWFFLLPFTGQDFNYDNPLSWAFKNKQCAGKRQSPIALYHGKITKTPPLAFHYYNVPLSDSLSALNNGHTVEVDVDATIDGSHPSISGGGLEDVYEAAGFHFHWGSPFQRGSEHSIGGRRYDMEMHIVHKNAKYGTIEEALGDPFGIAVLGILFKAVDSTVNETGLNAVYDTLPGLTLYKSEQEITETITMSSILGDLNTNKFFTYRGSLTTPPCAEAVTWFVFSDILPIERKYLQRFFKLFDSRGVRLLNNFRPIQPRYGRKVFYRKGT